VQSFYKQALYVVRNEIIANTIPNTKVIPITNGVLSPKNIPNKTTIDKTLKQINVAIFKANGCDNFASNSILFISCSASCLLNLLILILLHLVEPRPVDLGRN